MPNADFASWSLARQRCASSGAGQRLGTVLMSASAVIVAINARMLRLKTGPKPAVNADGQATAATTTTKRNMIMKNESRFGAKDGMCRVTTIRTSLITLAICSQVQVVHAQQAPGDGMHGTDGGWMGGWAGGWMWLWLVIGVLVVVLLVVLIAKGSRK